MAFNIGFYAYAIIGHTRADQLLPQLLMEQFDTLPLQCRHIEHMHEGVWFRKKYTPANFVCGGVYCFHVVRACVRACVRPCVRHPSVTFFF